MAEEYKVEVDLENATATFRIDLVGKKTRESYKGVFKVRCILNPMAFINADKTYRDLVGDPSKAHEHANALAFALAQLKYRVLKEAPFWTNKEFPGSHIEDDNIIIEVLNRALYCEEKFIAMKQEEADRIEKELTDDIMGGILQELPELEGGDLEEPEVDPDEVELS